MDANIELRERAIARLFEPVDKARAVFRGMVIVGHRASVPEGEMVWALPGGIRQRTDALKASDPSFAVIDAPHNGWLRDQQPVLAELAA